MRKTILTILGIGLIGASTVQFAAATERHHARNAVRTPIAQQVRNANDSLPWPSNAQPSWYSDYAEGHVISAPAGR